jgi:hypothetical protein
MDYSPQLVDEEKSWLLVAFLSLQLPKGTQVDFKN